MNKVVWRIATEAPAYPADDLSGTGAATTGGRWNAVNSAVVYTSETRALACLETLVHLNAGGLPFNRYLVEVMIPPAVWAKARHETATTLPVGWDAEPAGGTSLSFGTEWIGSGSSALLVVPSVIVPEEYNILINPKHPDSAGISAKARRKWGYDPRLKR